MINNSQTGFLDIHSHILPSMDDGPENYEQCIDAAQHYINIGVDCVIATPHCIPGTRWVPEPDQIIRVSAETEKIIQGAGIPLRILPGMEIAVSDLLYGNFLPDQYVSLAEKGAFLIEFPMNTSMNGSFKQETAKLLSGTDKIQFIIAHPERCAMFHDNIDWIQSLVKTGMLIQVNIGSILGHYGRNTQKTALDLFCHGLVHFLATDSHARGNRMPPDQQQMKQLARILGEQTLHEAFRDNPHHLINGRKPPPLAPKPAIRQSQPDKGFIHQFKKMFRQNSIVE